MGHYEENMRAVLLARNSIGNAELTQGRWNRIRKGARARGLPFTIEIGEAWALFVAQGRRCALSGLPIAFGYLRDEPSTASLDRINPASGYVAGNVQWLHKDVNRMKQNFSEAYFLELCRKISGR